MSNELLCYHLVLKLGRAVIYHSDLLTSFGKYSKQDFHLWPNPNHHEKKDQKDVDNDCMRNTFIKQLWPGNYL
jgi:hypothetical protein